MKVLLVDSVTDGHHLIYAGALAGTTAYEGVAVFPGKADFPAIAIPPVNLNGYRFADYFRFLRYIRELAEREQPDIIHFLNADVLVNYMGLGFGALKGYKILLTFHHFFGGFRKEFGLKRLLRGVSGAVVHTESLQTTFSAYGRNIFHVEYPDFLWSEQEEIAATQPEQGKGEARTLLCLGQTRRDKGLDILLEALCDVVQDFRLIVAGAVCDFDESYIRERIRPYADRVELDLRYLPEEVMRGYLARADVIVLPYRREFDGASGPLTEGVGLMKCIVGPDGGCLGTIIRKNHLGYTFTAEDVASLRGAVEDALSSAFFYDETALAYRDRLSPARFLKDYEEVYRVL